MVLGIRLSSLHELSQLIFPRPYEVGRYHFREGILSYRPVSYLPPGLFILLQLESGGAGI